MLDTNLCRCGQPLAENNVAECFYDGGDCCEYSCYSRATFSCGVDGWECYDPNAPTYRAAQLPDPRSLIVVAIIIVIGYIWCCFFCFLFFSGRQREFLRKKRRAPPVAVASPGFNSSGPGDAPADAPSVSTSERQEPKVSASAMGFAWALLEIELGVTTYLFLDGKGPTSKQLREYRP